jgi:excisionase family DNA binding protein
MAKRIRTLTELLGTGGLMNVAEVSVTLNVSQPCVYAWAKAGVLPAVQLSEQVLRFRPEDVRDFIDGKRGK